MTQLRLWLFVVFAMAVYGQQINAGGPSIAPYVADQGFTGGTAYGSFSQADPGWKALRGIYSTLRYGPAFSYDLVVPNGSCSVKLDLLENRPAVTTSGVPAAGVGARIFTVALNGVVSPPIDIFAVVGAQTPYSPPPMTTLVTNGHLRLAFKGIVGNAVVSAIEVTCTGPTISLLKCTAAPTSTSDCSGLFYIDLVTAAGTELKLIGVAPTNPLNPAQWSPVP